MAISVVEKPPRELYVHESGIENDVAVVGQEQVSSLGVEILEAAGSKPVGGLLDKPIEVRDDKLVLEVANSVEGFELSDDVGWVSVGK